MKAYLLFQDRDFDFGADLPPGHQDLIQDLELTTLLQAMAAGDKFVYGVSTKVLLACLGDPEAIRYRQRILADCLAQPERHPPDVRGRDRRPGGQAAHLGRLRRHIPESLDQPLRRGQRRRKPMWPGSGNCGRSPTTMPGSSAPTGCGGCSPRCRRDLDDEYFGEISYHLKQLRFRDRRADQRRARPGQQRDQLRAPRSW